MPLNFIRYHQIVKISTIHKRFAQMNMYICMYIKQPYAPY